MNILQNKKFGPEKWYIQDNRATQWKTGQQSGWVSSMANNSA